MEKDGLRGIRKGSNPSKLSSQIGGMRREMITQSNLIHPFANRGEIEIKVCYEIDANGILNVSAREITTGTNNSIKITEIGSLSKAEIEKMIEDAERFKFEDEAHMKKAMAHRDLDQYVSKLRSKIQEYKVRLSLIKMGLSVKDLDDLDKQIGETIDWLDENPDAEKGEFKDKKEELYNIYAKLQTEEVTQHIQSFT